MSSGGFAGSGWGVCHGRDRSRSAGRGRGGAAGHAGLGEPPSPHLGGCVRSGRLHRHRLGVFAQDFAHLADGEHRDGAGLAEITHALPARTRHGYPSGIRVIVRRERPHPGAQLDAFEEADGWRYTAFATDTRFGQLAHLDARHRADARVEDRIRTAKDTGLDHFPSRSFAINQAWLSVVMLAVDLIAWTQHLLLHGDLAKAEPKTLRYRLLHVAARLTRGQRQHWGCASTNRPWAHDPDRSVGPTQHTAGASWLIFNPDTTSGRSDRQNSTPA